MYVDFWIVFIFGEGEMRKGMGFIRIFIVLLIIFLIKRNSKKIEKCYYLLKMDSDYFII